MATSLHDQLGGAPASAIPSFTEIMRLVSFVLAPERSFYTLAIIYSVAISLLTLAVPVSVQALITSVANTGLPQAVAVLAGLLFAVLMLSSILVLLRHYLMERLQRRMYARLSSWISRELLDPAHKKIDREAETLLLDRYFDIMTLKTHIPELLMGGVTILLQTIVGAIVVSFYHPLLLLFSAVLMITIYLIWRIWGPTAARSSVALSHAKYDTAAWLHELGYELRAAGADADRKGLAEKSDQKIADYLKAHITHFHHHYRQVICFALIYAVANAALLGLGGYLVILGELTLGQLVAAELILSVILLSVGQFGQYLDKFYDVCAASEELSLFERLNHDDELIGNPPFNPPANAPATQ